MYKYFKKIGTTESISSWESKVLSNEVIKAPDNSLAPAVKFTGEKMYVKFSGDCLKQDKITFNNGKIVNIYIVYDLKSNLNNFDFTTEHCLFGAAKILKNNGNAYGEGYGIRFDSKGSFSHPTGGNGQNIMIIGADMSSSVHFNNRKKYILAL